MSGLRESRVKPWHVAGLLTLAIALLQVAWIFSVRPYGQMDEVDHSYRAASVARGHIVEGTPDPAAYGDLIPVPGFMVIAAHHRCSQLPYMKADNCTARTAATGNGEVEVASAAARYNPLYYATVGWATLATDDGVAALEIMRATTALVCDVVFFLAAWTTLRFGRRSGATVGLFVALMPVAVCASTSAAPNGLQMAAGLAMWSALAALITQPALGVRSKRPLLWLASGMAVVVVVTHTTGPLWVLLSGAAFLAAMGRRTRDLWRQARSALVGGGVVVASASAAMAAWTLLDHTNSFGGAGRHFGPQPLGDLLGQPLAWWFQTVGAVPYRDNPAPLWVYAVAMAEFAVLITLAFIHGSRRARGVVIAIGAATLAVSVALNTVAYPYIGNAWQGRYTLALAYGMPLLAGWALRDRPALVRWLVPASALATAVVNAGALINVRVVVEGRPWSAADGIAPAPVTLVVALAMAAGLLMVGAAWRARYFVAETHRSSVSAAAPSSMAAAARAMPAAIRSSSEPAPAS